MNNLKIFIKNIAYIKTIHYLCIVKQRNVKQFKKYRYDNSYFNNRNE